MHRRTGDLGVMYRADLVPSDPGALVPDRLLGGPIGSSDEGFDDDEEDRVQQMGDLLANIVM